MCRLCWGHAGGHATPFLGLRFPIPHRTSQGKAFGECDPPFCPLPHPCLCRKSRHQMWGDAVMRNICRRSRPGAGDEGMEAALRRLRTDIRQRNRLRGVGPEPGNSQASP